MDKTTIAQGLPGLASKDLRELRARIDFLLKGGQEHVNGQTNGDGKAPGTEDPVLMLLEIVSTLCRERGLESRPLARLMASQGFQAFAEKVPEVLGSLGSDRLSTAQLRSILRLALGLVLEQLGEMGVPASATTLMGHVHRIPGVLDANFPGYRQAGLLKLLARNEHE